MLSDRSHCDSKVKSQWELLDGFLFPLLHEGIGLNLIVKVDQMG